MPGRRLAAAWRGRGDDMAVWSTLASLDVVVPFGRAGRVLVLRAGVQWPEEASAYALQWWSAMADGERAGGERIWQGSPSVVVKAAIGAGRGGAVPM